MIRMLIGLYAAILLAAPTMAGVTVKGDVSAAQARAAAGHSPTAVQLVDARRVNSDRVAVTLRLWSSTRALILAGIPSDHAGWALHGADGRPVSGIHFLTIGYDPVTTTGANGHNLFLLRYDEPVTIPVMIDHDIAQTGSKSLEVAILACDFARCWATRFTFARASIS